MLVTTRKRYKTELTNCFHKTFKPTFRGRLIFLHFFKLFLRKVLTIYIICYIIINVREIPLTIKKGEKYEAEKGKEKTTQKEENKSNL